MNWWQSSWEAWTIAAAGCCGGDDGVVAVAAGRWRRGVQSYGDHGYQMGLRVADFVLVVGRHWLAGL